MEILWSLKNGEINILFLNIFILNKIHIYLIYKMIDNQYNKNINIKIK